MKQGFTLIESLIYMALLAMFLIVLTNVLATTLETLTESSKQSAIDSDAMYIMTRLSYDVGRSTDISVSENTLTLSVGSYTLSNGYLLLSGEQTNSFSSRVESFIPTKIRNESGKATVRIYLDLISGDKSKSLISTFGLR